MCIHLNPEIKEILKKYLPEEKVFSCMSLLMGVLGMDMLPINTISVLGTDIDYVDTYRDILKFKPRNREEANFLSAFMDAVWNDEKSFKVVCNPMSHSEEIKELVSNNYVKLGSQNQYALFCANRILEEVREEDGTIEESMSIYSRTFDEVRRCDYGKKVENFFVLTEYAEKYCIYGVE